MNKNKNSGACHRPHASVVLWTQSGHARLGKHLAPRPKLNFTSRVTLGCVQTHKKPPKYSQRKVHKHVIRSCESSPPARQSWTLSLHGGRRVAANAGVTHAGDRNCLPQRVINKHYGGDRKPFGGALGARGMCCGGRGRGGRASLVQTFRPNANKQQLLTFLYENGQVGAS